MAVSAGARVVSVNTGREQPASWAGELKRTAIDKRPVTGPVQAGELGLDGDEQADKADHGGPDQALYAYAREDLDWWAAQLGRDLRDGIFGENITTAGLDVSNAVIGETWRFGEVVVQVTSPRVPCGVFRNWMDEKGWIKTFRAAGRPGAYLRVCQTGRVAAGDPVEVLSRPPASYSIADALEAYYQRDVAVIRRLLAVPGRSAVYQELAADWLGTAAG